MKSLFMYKKGRIFLLLLIIQILKYTNCYSLNENLHHKRASLSSSSSLQFDFESNSKNVSIDNNHYHKIGTDRINFTCTVLKPSFRLTLKIDREQEIKGQPLAITNIINEFKFNPELGDISRYSKFDYEEDKLYKAVFQIRKLQLSDNGKYTCIYGDLKREIKLHVYEPLDLKDTSLTIIDTNTSVLLPYNDGKLDVDIGKSYQFLCKVNEIYPKPQISFAIDNVPETSQVKHNEHIVLKNDFYVVKTSSTLDFTVTHKNHQNTFSCVISPQVPGVPAIVKPVTLRVRGIHIIDTSCIDSISFHVGDKDVEVTCTFYAYPEPSVQWTVASTDDIQETSEDNNEHKENLDENLENRKHTKVLENDENGAYSYAIQHVDTEPGIHKAILKIKEVTSENDLKDLTINIDINNMKITRVFRFAATKDSVPTEAVLNGNTNIKKSIHSILLSSIIGFIFIKNTL